MTKKNTITLTKEQAHFVQQMTLDLRSIIHRSLKLPILDVAHHAMMEHGDKLKKFYEEIEVKLFALQREEST